MAGVRGERTAGFAFAEEELDHDGLFIETRCYGFSRGGAWCSNFLGSKMRDGGERVDFADGGPSVVDVEVSERGVACTAIKASSWKG